jgi:hypothetical protein
MFDRLRFKVSRFLIRTVGNIQFFKVPFFCLLWSDTHYKVGGEEMRKITDSLEPGDIVFRKYDRYISGFFIPGFWTHVGVVVGDGKTIVHAMEKGVIEEDVLTYLRTDYVKVLRHEDKIVAKRAAETAVSLKGREYDFIFDTTDDSRLYCSELVKFCYPGVLSEVSDGAIPPDEIMKARLDVIHDSKEFRKKED